MYVYNHLITIICGAQYLTVIIKLNNLTVGGYMIIQGKILSDQLSIFFIYLIGKNIFFYNPTRTLIV